MMSYNIVSLTMIFTISLFIDAVLQYRFFDECFIDDVLYRFYDEFLQYCFFVDDFHKIVFGIDAFLQYRCFLTIFY